MRSFRLSALLLAVIFLAVLVSCSAATTQPKPSADKNTVIIQNYKFTPSEITIQKGETITWINMDSIGHTATGSSFDSGMLGNGQSFKFTFTVTGTFDYLCTPHPYMTGRIIVK